MIRELRKADINRVAKIWLDTNINAHYFISAQYWKSNFELVMHTMLNRIKGCEIYGIFICGSWWSSGGGIKICYKPYTC